MPPKKNGKNKGKKERDIPPPDCNHPFCIAQWRRQVTGKCEVPPQGLPWASGRLRYYPGQGPKIPPEIKRKLQARERARRQPVCDPLPSCSELCKSEQVEYYFKDDPCISKNLVLFFKILLLVGSVATAKEEHDAKEEKRKNDQIEDENINKENEGGNVTAETKEIVKEVIGEKLKVSDSKASVSGDAGPAKAEGTEDTSSQPPPETWPPTPLEAATEDEFETIEEFEEEEEVDKK